MSRWSWLILAFAFVGCSTIQVSSDYDPKADFSALRTYQWLPAPKIKSGDPRIQYDSLLGARIHKAVDQQLAAKGFELSAEKPDFLVTYHVAIDEKVSVTYLNELYGYRRGWGWDSRRSFRHYDYPGPAMLVTEYNQGTLILDVVRSDNKQLIWRGTATAEIYEDSSPEAREKRIGVAIEKILAQFPPSRQ